MLLPKSFSRPYVVRRKCCVYASVFLLVSVTQSPFLFLDSRDNHAHKTINNIFVRAFGDHGKDGLAFLEDDDDYSSFVMPEKFDFDVTFPYNSGPLGLTVSEARTIISIEDNLAADLTGMLRVGDQLIGINDKLLPPLDGAGDAVDTNRVSAAISQQLRILETNNHREWFYLRFRPSVFEQRKRAELHDVNITIQQGEKIGLLLSSDLKILEIREQRSSSENLSDKDVASDGVSHNSGKGNLLPGDQLIMINDRTVVGKKLNDVLPILKGISSTTMNGDKNKHRKSLKLRFRSPLAARQKRTLAKTLGNNVNQDNRKTYTITFSETGPLGISLDESLVVQGFGMPSGYDIEDDAAEDSAKLDALLYFPAERSGQILPGDRLIAINGKRVTKVENANKILNVPVKSRRLHCRGGIHCGIEIVRNTPDVRVVTFAVGKRNRRNPNIMDVTNAGVNQPTIASLGNLTNRGNDKSIYSKSGTGTLEPVSTNANGIKEPVFYAKRGILKVVDAEKQELRSFDFTTGLFGGALWCKEHEIHIPNPSDACEELSGEERLRNKYVLVNRGRCFFSTKAIHAQYAGAAGLIVIDSKENEGNLPKRMPSAESDRHLIKIPAIMISHASGKSIISLLTNAASSSETPPNSKVLGLLQTEENNPNSLCQQSINDESKETSDDRGTSIQSESSTKLLEQGGHLEILNHEGHPMKKYEYMSAKFGKNLLLKSIVSMLKIANPIKGCDPIQNDVNGSVVVMQRGTCSLVEKVERAQEAGAIGALVINNKNGLQRMETWDQKFRPYYVKSKHNITIFAGMITKQAGAELIEVLHDIASAKNLFVRLKSNGAHVERWNQLNTLFDIDTWPKDPDGRAQLYLEYAKKNNPNLPYGSDERFQCLQLARKIVETHYAGIKLRDKLIKDRKEREDSQKNMK